jgi:hypothetical protein
MSITEPCFSVFLKQQPIGQTSSILSDGDEVCIFNFNCRLRTLFYSPRRLTKAKKGQGENAPIIKKTFLHHPKTNQRFRLNGDIPSDRRPAKEALCKDFTQHIVYAESQLPSKADLRPWMTKIEDQSQINSW